MYACAMRGSMKLLKGVFGFAALSAIVRRRSVGGSVVFCEGFSAAASAAGFSAGFVGSGLDSVGGIWCRDPLLRKAAEGKKIIVVAVICSLCGSFSLWKSTIYPLTV